MTEKIKHSLYDGEVELEKRIYKNYHAYFVTDEENGIDSERTSGVTTFTGIKDKSAPIKYWATRLYRDFLFEALEKDEEITEADVVTGSILHEQELSEAQNIGSEIHDWIDLYIKSKVEGTEEPELPTDKAILVGIKAFFSFMETLGDDVEFIKSEFPIYSRNHGYSGTVDLKIRIDDKLYLWDTKTANGLYNDVAMQTAAYVKADEEESGDEYDGRIVVRLAKETEEEYYERKEHENKCREIADKKPKDIPEYQLFEAKFLDDEGCDIEEDFEEGFLSAKNLHEWNKKSKKLFK